MKQTSKLFLIWGKPGDSARVAKSVQKNYPERCVRVDIGNYLKESSDGRLWQARQRRTFVVDAPRLIDELRTIRDPIVLVHGMAAAHQRGIQIIQDLPWTYRFFIVPNDDTLVLDYGCWNARFWHYIDVKYARREIDRLIHAIEKREHKSRNHGSKRQSQGKTGRRRRRGRKDQGGKA